MAAYEEIARSVATARAGFTRTGLEVAMRFLVSQIETWGAEIDALPAPDPGGRKVGKREALAMLAKQLQAAARRGYSTTMLHGALSEMGLKVHVDTLRAALRAAGRFPAKRPSRTARTEGSQTRPRAAATPPLDRPSASETNGSQNENSPATTRKAEPPRSAPRLEGRPTTVDRTRYVPRGDSDDL
jgi:hypothetical protein